MTGRILVADDNVDNRKLLRKTLTRLGHEVIEACDGREALALCVELHPDLILLDIVMPEMDGYEVCSFLKAREQTEDIPIIFLSAKSDAKDKIKGLEIGGVDYITKPFDRGEVLARVQNQLRIRALMKELLDKQARLDEDLRAAAAIQRTLLPQRDLDVEGIELAWRFIPCEMVGGDIFNVVRLDESHLGFYILDVSGHGVPSAMVTVSVSQMLQPNSGYLTKKRTEASPYYEIVSPGRVLHALDREYPVGRFDKYFTMVYMVLEIHTGHLRYSNAAHPLPVVVHPDGSLEVLDKGGTIIGLDGIVPFEEGETELKPGDKLFLYTDGLTELRNEEGQVYGEDRFFHLLVDLKARPVAATLERVHESLAQFAKQAKPQDDVTLAGFEFKRQGNQ